MSVVSEMTPEQKHEALMSMCEEHGLYPVAKVMVDDLIKTTDSGLAFREIINMCVENDFYVDEVCSEIVVDLAKSIDRGNVHPRYTLINNRTEVQGFAIMYEFTDVKGKVDIKFFFIKPEYRRKGIAKEYFRRVMTKYQSIYTDTSSENYVKMITDLGFTEVGKCSETDEICYKWEKKVKKKGKGKRRK